MEPSSLSLIAEGELQGLPGRGQNARRERRSVIDFLTACGALERRLRACLGGSLAALAVMTSWPGAAMAGPCRVVVADEEVRCPYHAIDSTRHNVVFVDLADDAIRAADIGKPDSPSADLAFDPFLADLGWTALATAVAPDLRRALVMRAKPSCPPYTGSPGPGVACSYGRVTLWLAYHDRRTGEWVHVNLARRGLGRNSEAHGWSTWLHRDLALFNAIVFPDDGGFYTRQEENVTQIYAVRFRSDRDFAIEPFAPDLLWRADCLTGRVNAQPPMDQDRCFDGQRVSFVRRCYSEPLAPDTWAWWNTAAADGTGGPCIPGQPAMQVPVLRTYVMELDASCRPKHPFASMSPAHVPVSGPVYRQMGVGPEWGDMLSAISPDGRYLAMATNMGDPQRPGDNCAGMKMNLRDPDDPLSGEADRIAHVCELDSSLRCSREPMRVGTLLTPPESTPLPGFVQLPPGNGFARHLVFSRRWSQSGRPQVNDIVRVDLDIGPDALVPLRFGHHAVAILPISYVPPPRRTGCSSAGAPGDAWWWVIVVLVASAVRRGGPLDRGARCLPERRAALLPDGAKLTYTMFPGSTGHSSPPASGRTGIRPRDDVGARVRRAGGDWAGFISRPPRAGGPGLRGRRSRCAGSRTPCANRGRPVPRRAAAPREERPGPRASRRAIRRAWPRA